MFPRSKQDTNGNTNDMMQTHRALWTTSAAALGTGLLAIGCSGGSLDADEAAAGLFTLQSVSVAEGQTWQINRPITFTFSHAVDFDSVNMNTISIAQVSGGPAVGTYTVDPADPRKVTFQPTCPTAGDFSDAGLIPGGIDYRISVPEDGNGAGTVLSAGGSVLRDGHTMSFFTPVSEILTDLFLDPQTGPPAPLEGYVDADGIVQGTRLETGGGSAILPFVIDPTGEGNLGVFEIPLNLYSDTESRVEVLVEVNQPVSPTDENISQDRLQIQFEEATGSWVTFPTRVSLDANCTETGAVLRLTPLGVLPQNRNLRVIVKPEFEDLVGDRNILPLEDFAVMKSSTFTEGGEAVDYADDFFEDFVLSGGDVGSFEDVEATFDTPRAEWGEISPGVYGVRPSFDFDGTGGPGGDFDWHIPSNQTVILDTTSTLIIGGPGGVPTATQLVINGIVNIRDLYIPENSVLKVQGPNPAVLLCAGEVRIEGELDISGNNAKPVFTLNTPFQPEPGASGNGGGGAGGTGSYLTNQVTPRGGNGFGAFDTPGAGGQGGESGWNSNTGNYGQFRGAAGGGGGTLGLDVVLADGCNDQMTLGLDAENGFAGHPSANAATRPGETLPWGGFAADRPFTDINGTGDDFWGTMRKDFGTEDEELVEGELIQPWPASGGGAGGDATRATEYPPSELLNSDQDKGCGGGGGSGALTVLALGKISMGINGKITARGGHGSGGENTNYVNRIGGGSGGGAGGHIILQTAQHIDLSELPQNGNPNAAPSILARGGQGGAGYNNAGGADDNELTPQADAHHTGGGGDNPFEEPLPPQCAVQTGIVVSAGGDGGPGLIQFHVGTLPDDVIGPSDDSGLVRDAVKPAPVGYDIGTGSGDADWVNQLLPIFGRLSKAQSKWIPLGGASINPDDPNDPDPIQFLFEGTDPATGLVESTEEVVENLPAILAPAAAVESEGLPDIGADGRTMLLDAAELALGDEVYRRNPNLFRLFRLRVGSEDHDVTAASYDEQANVLSLTVSGSDLPTSGQVEVFPRYFAVSTNGVADAMPDSSTVLVSFQATGANSLGDPDESAIFPGTSAWSTDIGALSGAPGNTDFRFFRFQLSFDILADNSDLSFNTPRPVIDFLRIPFRF
ncbi:MAG: hypothetical protein QGI46_04495 [Planctomycetota bacterium]|jgi:hypothetical protein|nr:hypothetical protein [Planctomycetota bacterium]